MSLWRDGDSLSRPVPAVLSEEMAQGESREGTGQEQTVSVEEGQGSQVRQAQSGSTESGAGFFPANDSGGPSDVGRGNEGSEGGMSALDWDAIWSEFDDWFMREQGKAKCCKTCGRYKESKSDEWEVQQKAIQRIVGKHVRRAA